MADVRSLLAAERNSRRIQHPHLSYTKSGLLQCTVCHLNIRSESLWEGHLKSANHRRNAQTLLGGLAVSKKRKADQDEDVEEDQTRKKNKSLQMNGTVDGFIKENSPTKAIATNALEAADEQSDAAPTDRHLKSTDDDSTQPLPHSGGPGLNGSEILSAPQEPDTGGVSLSTMQPPPRPRPGRTREAEQLPKPNATLGQVPSSLDPSNASTDLDEAEWARFLSDVEAIPSSPTASAQPQPASKLPDYASFTISAPALSAAELQKQQSQAATSASKRDRDAEAQDEKEEEEQRMQDEFAVMEEMEERVRRLKEKREALRLTAAVNENIAPSQSGEADRQQEDLIGQLPDHSILDKQASVGNDEDEDDDEDEVDDWFS